jgi:hypothetical protein
MAARAVRLCFLLAFAAAMAGCTDNKSIPTSDPNLFPKDYKTEIVNTLRQLFEKNDTVRVTDAFISDPALRPVGNEQHYAACVRYTAHGVQAGMVGNAERIAYFYGGQLNQLIPASKEQCGDAAYKPFAELNKLCIGKGCR